MEDEKLKNIEDLTEAEVLALTERDIQRYIDRACAEEGIRLWTAAPTPPEGAQVSDDMPGYALGPIYFARKEDADQVAALANTFERLNQEYIPGPGYRKRWEKRTNEDEVKVERLLSPTRALGMAEEIRRFEVAKERFDKEKREYEKQSGDRSRISTKIRRLVAEVQAAESTRQRLRAEFDRYLELADGMHRVACRFMLKAFPDAEQHIPEKFNPEAQPIGQLRVRDYSAVNEEKDDLL